MQKIILTVIILTLMGCQTIKNGLAEPKTPQQTAVITHYEYVATKTDIQINFVKAKPDTTKQLPITVRTYTIPIPTKK